MIITNFVSKQITNQSQQKNKLFAKNIQFCLLTLINNLLKINQTNISGLKVMFVGKWKKTKSGRKQRLILNLGKIGQSTISNPIFFHQTVQKTKFGSCNLKIWIAIK